MGEKQELDKRQVMLALILLLASAAPIFVSLGDHPLFGRSDARYAEASREMLESGDWLVPRLLGRPHLTKPPLIYWLQAASMKWLGENELAARLPSAVAGSLTLALIMAVGWQWRSWHVGAMSAGVLALMPLALIVSRLPLTDALLGFFWLGILASGLFAVRWPKQWRWPLLLCAAMTGAWMTKGPLALVPLGVLLVWLAFSGQWRAMGRLRLWWTVPLSLLPVGVWAAMVVVHRPGVWGQWYQETISRVVGEGDHLQPMWFFIPVFLVGLFPATAMLEVPGLNLSWRSAWGSLRRGSDEALWALAVVLPFVFFSLSAGKLATYILPCAPPLALLTAVMLERWVSGENDRGISGYKPPEVMGAVTVCLSLAWLGVLVAAGWFFGWRGALLMLPMAVGPAAAAWLWPIWKKRPPPQVRRGFGLTVLFAALIAVTCYSEELEDALLHEHSIRSAVRHIHGMDLPAEASWMTVGKLEYGFSFYHGAQVPVATPEDIAAIGEADAQSPGVLKHASPQASRTLPVRSGRAVPGSVPGAGVLICYPDKLAVLRQTQPDWPGAAYRLMGEVLYNPRKDPLVVFARIEPAASRP
ncbi:MAG: glycosyltransferase family 39 protein [Phycisphaeraceae bacterium]|nr:glycosyltransferase family 39 protein [Phycisphaeraceae bacterium]